MLSLYPNVYFDKIEKITIEFLQKNKIKALILDMDNTLINYKKEMPENIENWAKELNGQGMKLYILSNTNKKKKVISIAKKLGVPYKSFAKKPLKSGFLKVQKELGFKPEQIAVVGDQIFTDVIGGNRCNMFTILVDSIDNKDFWYIKMYINDVHIAYYLVAAILGLIVGEIVSWTNKRLPEYKKVISREFITEYKINFKPSYILMLLTAVIYVTLVYVYGIQDTLIANLDLIKFIILTPMLLSAFVIDYKLQIIPNRLNLTIFEVGIIFAFLYGLSNMAITINMLLGMVAGGGIFLLITLLGGLFYGKEAMGFGDVKLMGALGLFFGLSNIIVITLVSFLIGAILSIILLATKIKKSDEYIPFGPFIVIATFLSMYVPFEQIKNALMTIFTLGMYQG